MDKERWAKPAGGGGEGGWDEGRQGLGPGKPSANREGCRAAGLRQKGLFYKETGDNGATAAGRPGAMLRPEWRVAFRGSISGRRWFHGHLLKELLLHQRRP